MLMVLNGLSSLCVCMPTQASAQETITIINTIWPHQTCDRTFHASCAWARDDIGRAVGLLRRGKMRHEHAEDCWLKVHGHRHDAGSDEGFRNHARGDSRSG